MAEETLRYKDPSRPIHERVEDLLSRMTLEEKVAQLGSRWSFELLGPQGPDPERMRTVIPHGIGQVTRVGGMLDLPPAVTAQIANAIQRWLVHETRLGIPAIIHEECLNGYVARDATIFPQIIGVAATWDPELARQMATVIRTQMRSVGAHQGLAPVLDVARDPRWGRTEETYGEDPYLVSRMGSAYVSGLQGDDPKTGIIATGKHFVGYSASEGGLNWAPAHIPERELYEVFARPFEAAIRESRLGSVMNAYNELDGVPCGVSREILTDLLRDRLGFKGFVVSDYMTISTAFSYHHISTDLMGAAVQAIQAGLDVELPTVEGYGDLLVQAVRQGLVSEETIDRSVRRVLEAKFRLGLFEQPYVDPAPIPEIFARPEGRDLAYKIAVKSMTLLKNEGQLLPLSKSLSRIAVIGPNADSARNLLGDYTFVSQIQAVAQIMRSGALEIGQLSEEDRKAAEALYGDLLKSPDDESFTRNRYRLTTVLEAIRQTVSQDTEVTYAKGCDVQGTDRSGFEEAVRLAREADVAILVLGEKSGLDPSATSGEARDRADLGLPGVQQELLEAVHATGTPVVLVVLSGRPLALKWAAAHVPAILMAWVPGQEGGRAVASVLFGDEAPGGRLPISMPRSVGQVPIYYYHKPSGGRSHWLGDYVEESTSPLFPFGYGLTYTTFDYTNLRIDPAEVDGNGQVRISVDVTNKGARAGDEVVQLYVHDAESAITRPVKQLVGFQRVTLEPGQACTVSFTLRLSQLAFLNREMELVVEPGTIEVMVGSSAEEIRVQGAFRIVGDVIEVDANRAFFPQVEVTYH